MFFIKRKIIIFVCRIVSALKNANSEPDGSGYDPMSMLRQNKKTVFDDNNEEKIDEKIENKSTTEEEDLDENSEVVVEETDEEKVDTTEEKREYHSATDSDDDAAQEFPIRIKKLVKKSDDLMENKEETNEKKIDEIVGEPSGRQTVLLSATLTNAVEKLAGLTMTDPIFVDAAEDNLKNSGGNMNEINEDLVVPQSVVQSYVVTPPKLRMVTLSAYIAGRCQVTCF